MSTTESGRTTSPSEVRARADDDFRRVERPRETKPSFMTTEFWAMILGLAALVVIYHMAEEPSSLTLWRATLLGTVLATGYIVSRGLAKSGSSDRKTERTDRTDRTDRY
jgi:hypothetical protein